VDRPEEQIDRSAPSLWGAALLAAETAAIECRLCPRLVAHREAVALEPPRRHAGEEYWARPVPGFGDPRARVLVLGLAPSAHGGNRTGRSFTGNRSADWLIAALHRTGYADQASSEQRGDGLTLEDVWMTSAVRCAPPANKPTEAERETCARHLLASLHALDSVAVIVPLGAFAWAAAHRSLGISPIPRFGHGVESAGPSGLTILGCYHPSPQNTATGRLTAAMTDSVLRRARVLASNSPYIPSRNTGEPKATGSGLGSE
jgi:uracil-DNA glycosylase